MMELKVHASQAARGLQRWAMAAVSYDWHSFVILESSPLLGRPPSIRRGWVYIWASVVKGSHVSTRDRRKQVTGSQAAVSDPRTQARQQHFDQCEAGRKGSADLRCEGPTQAPR